mmetsp:Transcript_26593/g.39515  ORF Transcript_26593/g.39515 Transcript_26593/m.39515 type:complete len:223 (+) Transcript_26593:120-788(+)
MENNRDPHKRSHSHQDEHEQDIISRETETKRANYTAKGYWTPTEDKKLKTIVMNGSTPINWNDVVRHFPNRSRKQCRERWLEYLNPDIDNSEFTPFEDQLILQFQEKLGNKWKEISEQMMEKKRTATQVKVYIKQSSMSINCVWAYTFALYRYGGIFSSGNSSVNTISYGALLVMKHLPTPPPVALSYLRREWLLCRVLLVLVALTFCPALYFIHHTTHSWV